MSDRINFENQFKTGINNGIVEYSFVDKQLFIKSTMDFLGNCYETESFRIFI